MIAALYVQKNGAYYGLPNVDSWDEERDARKYAGPWPVVAHPPCNRWSIMATIGQAMGRFKIGDDGGCFESALNAVRTYGGVLEHPAKTFAWKHHGLLKPPAGGAWTRSLFDDGWVCQVDQAYYDHRARKITWLYAVGVDLARFKWGENKDVRYRVSPFSWSSDDNSRLNLTRKQASATPTAFKHELIQMAESVNRRKASA